MSINKKKYKKKKKKKRRRRRRRWRGGSPRPLPSTKVEVGGATPTIGMTGEVNPPIVAYTICNT
jgi:hypothetical protein